MRHIFWSTWNANVIAQSPDWSQQPTRRNGELLVADYAEKKISLSWSFNWLQLSLYQVGLEVNTVIGDVMGWRNSKSIELSSSDDPTQVADWVTGASRV